MDNWSLIMKVLGSGLSVHQDRKDQSVQKDLRVSQDPLATGDHRAQTAQPVLRVQSEKWDRWDPWVLQDHAESRVRLAQLALLAQTDSQVQTGSREAKDQWAREGQQGRQAPTVSQDPMVSQDDKVIRVRRANAVQRVSPDRGGTRDSKVTRVRWASREFKVFRVNQA